MRFSEKSPSKQRLFTAVTVIAVILAGIAASFLRGGGEDPAYLTFHSEGYLSIKDESGAVTDVYYTDMTAVDYVQSPDFGTPEGGSIAEDTRLGQWRSPQFGSYRSCTQTGLNSCIWIRTAEGAYVISWESDDTTRALYQAIEKARDQLSQEQPEQGK